LRAGDNRATHFPPARVFTHFLLAAGGLVVWIVYLVTDNSLLAWVAFADLVLVALLGGLLVIRWARDGRVAMRAGGRSDAVEVDLAEQHIPRPPVLLHGVFAVSTVVLVLLSALGIGES
jgi:manganese efflux pump family protein